MSALRFVLNYMKNLKLKYLFTVLCVILAADSLHDAAYHPFHGGFRDWRSSAELPFGLGALLTNSALCPWYIKTSGWQDWPLC
jgi:hypothetical protein